MQTKVSKVIKTAVYVRGDNGEPKETTFLEQLESCVAKAKEHGSEVIERHSK